MNPEKRPEVPPVISLTGNREVIARKLAEYKTRLGNPNFEDGDSICKIEITQKLVDTGEADRESIRQAMVGKYSEDYMEYFDDAWVVIVDYIQSGGAHTQFGTGLHPKGPDDEDGGPVN